MRFLYLISFLFISVSCVGQLNVPCNNWLATPSEPSYVNVGNLNITGNKITVEALINRTIPYAVGIGNGNEGDVVSKHDSPSDVNYLLRPNHGYITTTNGFFGTPDICEIDLNKVYHIAMVYDGSTLKFYRNGFLMSQIAATGNLFQNGWPTRIGKYSGTVLSTFLGYINEVRIWNVARTQAEIRTYMNSSLPTPTTQTGLQAYYTFDNLLNKQGNTAWNGTLGGAASINSTTTNCNFLVDSCSSRNNVSNIINDYTPVISLNPCENKITVEDASTFNTGDTVLMIQMKGAVIDSANTAAFGTITNYRNAGNYEFNYVKSKTGNIIELRNTLVKQYDIPIGKVQLIRVPYFQNANIAATLTCLPWDGNKGGVLVLNVQDTATLNANIDVSGKGFWGGNSPNTGSTTLTCFINDYSYPKNNLTAAEKGESIYAIGDNIAWGKGAPANGGGGGIGHNSGGGGGANGGAGGLGGYQLLTCGNSPFDNRGVGGHALTYNSTQNKIFLGGGGGSGHVDNAGGSDMEGGNGGGIVIIRSGKIKSNGFKIIANGNNATQCSFTNFTDCHDGSGGGGGGGTILVETTNYISPLQMDANGGKGGDLIIYNALTGADKIGPGGGGGGGIVWLNSPSNPAGITSNFNFGTNGVIIQNNNDPWGATSGQVGTGLFNLAIPVATVPFKSNIDSVRLKDSATSCNSFDFKGFGFTNTNPVASWQWQFGDGNTANTQNATHAYTAGGVFTVKLVITDINGCKDSISKNVNPTFLAMDAGPADTVCLLSSTILQASTTGGTQFAWIPAIYLNNATLLNPVATPPSTTTFYLTATNAQGCSRTDSVIINVRSINSFTVNSPVGICKNDTIQLMASGGDLYTWLPAASLDNASIANPNASPQNTTPYTVQITDTICNNTATLSTMVTVLPLPTIQASKSNDIDCSTSQSQLNATGAVTYIWSAQPTLSNTNIRNPVATPLVTTQYVVKGTDLSGCKNADSIIVNVTNANKGGYLMPTGFTPNNDGKNDCYGLKYWGIVQEIDFSIYNRWGERVFHSTKVGDCWNGMYKGLPQSPAMFIYVIRAKTNCEPVVFRKGTFALIR